MIYSLSSPDTIADLTEYVQGVINASAAGDTLDFGGPSQTYVTGPLTLLPGRTYTGRATLRLRDGANASFVNLASGAVVDGLTIDGNASGQGTPSYLHGTLRGNGADDVVLRNCTVRGGYGSPVYLQHCKRARVERNLVTGAVRPAILITGDCAEYQIASNRITDCYEDGIKINASWVEDGAVVRNCDDGRIVDNVVDYSNVDLTTAHVDGNVLGIECWLPNANKGIATNNRVKILGNTVKGPRSFTLAGDFFGISCHGSDDAMIHDNHVTGLVDWGIEAVLANRVSIRDNHVSGYQQAGIIIPAGNGTTNFCSIMGNHIGATGRRGASGVFVNVIQGQALCPVIQGNIFYDPGFCAVWFKNTIATAPGAGAGGRVVGNTVIYDTWVEYKSDGTLANQVYTFVTQKADGIDIAGNKVVISSPALNQRVFLRIEGAAYGRCTDNIMEGTATQPAVWVLDTANNAGAGGWVFARNSITGAQRAFLIDRDGADQATGPGCVLDNNYYRNIGAGDVLRPVDIVRGT